MASTLQDTRSAVGALPGWLGHAVQTLLGSRFFVGVAGIFFIAFLAHVTSAPDRFPPIAGVNMLAIVGFAPDVGPAPALPTQITDQAHTAAQSAVQAGVPFLQGAFDSYIAGHPHAIMYGNYIGLAVSALCLLLGLYLLARQESRRA